MLLLKIVSLDAANWNQTEMAEALFLSQSEVSQSIARLKYSGLLDPKGKIVMKLGLMDFLQYGIKYAFPQRPGSVVRGIATSHSAAPLNEHINSTEHYVWPYGKGNLRGHGIQPLYPSVPQAALKDEKLHRLLALVDALRVGKARERELAIVELKTCLGIGE